VKDQGKNEADINVQISQDAFDGSKWGVDRLIANKGVQTVTIPKCIAPGQYLLRGELIALHSASSSMGAQFYMVSNSNFSAEVEVPVG
jgi:hypothetical protein